MGNEDFNKGVPGGMKPEEFVQKVSGAVESSERVESEGFLGFAVACMEDISFEAKTWQTLRAELERMEVSPEEMDSVNLAIGVLQSLNSLEDKKGVLESNKNKLVELSRALVVLRKAGQEFSQIEAAVTHLVSSLNYYADEADREEAGGILTGLSADDIEKKKAWNMGLNIK